MLSIDDFTNSATSLLISHRILENSSLRSWSLSKDRIAKMLFVLQVSMLHQQIPGRLPETLKIYVLKLVGTLSFSSEEDDVC